jgi:hypothetical protein
MENQGAFLTTAVTTPLGLTSSGKSEPTLNRVTGLNQGRDDAIKESFDLAP